MIGWIIFGGIVLLIVFLLICSVRINIVYENEIDYKVSYLFIRLYPTSEKAKARKKRKEEKKKAKQQKKEQRQAVKDGNKNLPAKTDNSASVEKTQSSAAISSEKPGASNDNAGKTENKDNGVIPKKKAAMDLDYIMQLVDGASPPVKRIIHKIRVNNLYVDYVVGGADAAAVALKYGAVNAGINVILCWLAETVRLHKKEINIEANFALEKSDIFAYCDIKLRLGTLIACGVWLLWRMIKIQLKKSAPKKRKKRRTTRKPVPKKQGT